MWIDAGQTVIVDGFSMKKIAGKQASFCIVSPEAFTARVKVGETVVMGKSVIKYGGLKHDLSEDLGTLSMNGKNRDQFKMEITDEKEGEIELTLSYAPTKATTGSPHSAGVVIDPQLTGVSKGISLSGTAYTDETPTINVDRETVTFPETKAGESRYDTVRVSSMDMQGDINVKIESTDGVFTISTNLILPNREGLPLGIEYRPKKEGTHTATITLSSPEAEPKVITVSGTATGDVTNPDKQGDFYPLDASKPIAELHETFDDVPHNKPFAIEGWKNIAEQNYRAWWGYDFNNPLVPDVIKADEQVAKATLFNSLNPAEAPYEMWLYTPALDFKNAASKIFTFRVSADKISDEARSDSIELYYVEPDDEEPNGLSRQKIDRIMGVAMPGKAENNEEWFEYHLDLSGQTLIADAFFMAFRVSGTGGKASSVSYYIDDVSFGRTDLPKLTIDGSTQVAFESVQNQTAAITAGVTAEHLTEPIKLTVGGANKSKFKVTPETLPVEGGSFKVEFSSDQPGVHAGYVKLSSRGAADVYLDMLVNNKENSSGMEDILTSTQIWTERGQIIVSSDREAQVQVFSITGHELASYSLRAGTSTLPHTFHAGIYIVRVVNELGTASYKLHVK